MFEATVIGNLAQEPSLRTYLAQDPICSLGLIHNWTRSTKDGQGQSGRMEYSQWVTVSCWGEELSDKANAFKKGDQVRVKGSVTFPSYTKRDGTPGMGVEIRATEIELVLQKPDYVSENILKDKSG